MHLNELSILNFKNYRAAEVRFDEKVNCLVGKNGSGKTNLLDAIYYLAFTKSFFNPSDSQNIFPGEGFFSIQGSFAENGEKDRKVQCSLKKGHKKVLKSNGKEYQRYADHIGSIPVVMVSPIDILLLIEGSETRRKWIDGIISQFDASYLDHLLNYNKALSQRNSQLKQLKSPGTATYSLLEIWDDQLIHHGKYLFERRTEVMKDISNLFDEYYRLISQGSERVNLDYFSHLQQEKDFSEQLRDSIVKDLRLQYTSKGIHKDELELMLDKRPMKKFASQGQQKTALMALRLAQARLITQRKGRMPLMLLDDIYDKLDSDRMARFLEVLKSAQFGQLFITDTNLEHMNALLLGCGMEGRFFTVEHGEVRQTQEHQELKQLN
ncbi:MAG: DNA replication/repair protein RecF [Vicingaceae bacterium]